LLCQAGDPVDAIVQDLNEQQKTARMFNPERFFSFSLHATTNASKAIVLV